jgi:hypothetical protein
MTNPLPIYKGRPAGVNCGPKHNDAVRALVLIKRPKLDNPEADDISPSEGKQR